MSEEPVWHPAYVGIGSNLEEPEAQVRRAFEALRSLPGTSSFVHSALYRSAPAGPVDQPDFINAAAAFLTRFRPLELLGKLNDLENVQGRQRGEHWGPRTLDLDLLVYGRETIDRPDLQVPHPRIQERNFVLLPLAEIAPHLRVPGRGNVLDLLVAVAGGARIERLGQER